MKCSVVGCNKTARGSGKRGGTRMCVMHETRWRRYGNPEYKKREPTKDVPILKATDAAYLAAFLDGEGSIGETHTSPGRKRKYTALSFYNTDRAIMDYIAGLLNVRVYKQPNKSYPNGSYWYVRIAVRYANEILRQIRPFMKHSKKIAIADSILTPTAAVNHDRR